MLNDLFRRRLRWMSIAWVVIIMELGSFSPVLAKTQPVVVQGERTDVIQRVVRFGDLNLAVSKDRDRLVKRVRYAINDVCRDNDYVPTLNWPERECVQGAWSSAHPQLDKVLNGDASLLSAATLVIRVQK
jgi:UrcA family protein